MALILASQSPRRRELLVRMGLEEFEIRPAQGEERVDPALSPAQLVEELSRQKAEETAAACAADDVIIAADTVVAVDDQVLGKPRDGEHAAQMLRSLSGRAHTVYTGVTVRRGGQVLTGHEATQVVFGALTEGQIAAYVATGEPLDKAGGRIWNRPIWADKAGGYGIQTPEGRALVKRIEGDYYNIVGLPLKLLSEMLREFGVETTPPPPVEL